MEANINYLLRKIMVKARG